MTVDVAVSFLTYVVFLLQPYILAAIEKSSRVGERLASSASSRSKLSNALKSSYVKTLVLAAIIIGGVVFFWFGLRAGLRTEYPLLTVASGSMVPTLNIGDLILVQGVGNASQLNVAPKPDGDIIVFRSPRLEGELIVHRAVYEELRDGVLYFRTEGDANFGPDTWYGSDTLDGMISERRLIGKVVGKAPWLGYIPLYIRTREGIILIVILILLIIFAEYIPVLFKKQSQQR